MADILNCTTESTKSMVDCLKKVPMKKLIMAMKSLFVFLDFVPYTTFGPVVEKGGKNPFIAEQPYKLLKEGKIYDVPWVASNTKHEGLYPAGCKWSKVEKKW